MTRFSGKPSKYRNVKTQVDGITFDSKAEANRYLELKSLQHAGLIRGFAMQPSFRFASGTRYIPDFIVCGYGGEIWVEDVKGVETAAFKLKAKLLKHEYPWLPLRIIK